MESGPALHAVSDDELLRRLGELVSHSHCVEADLVAHIGEVDARRLYARFAFPSMFAYCTEGLHLSEAEAYRRITVARAARKHEVLLPMLRDGRLHLSGIATLVPLLTPENRDSLLERATHRSKRQIEELVAELTPRPDVPSLIRRLPEKRQVSSPQVPVGSPGRERVSRPALGRAPGDPELVPDGALGFGGPVPNRLVPGGPVELVPGRVDQQPACLPPRPAVVEPLSPSRYRVQLTASAELRDKLQRLTALMRSEIPDGDLAAVIEAAVTEKLQRLEARRSAKTAAPRKTLGQTTTDAVTRHVPAAVRRAVHERDGGRCHYVDAQGRRCSERDRLEFHHRLPFAHGGDHSPANLSLLCRVHNTLMAELDYGRDVLARKRGGGASQGLVPDRAHELVPGRVGRQGTTSAPQHGLEAPGRS